METIDVFKLKEMMGNKEDFLLIDIREPHENAAFNIGGKLMPMSELMERLDEIPAGKTVVFYCQKGMRSVIAIQRLQQKLSSNRLINLTAGMDGWIKAFGPTSPEEK